MPGLTLKLVSDGTPQGTSIVDDEGREVENVSRIHWYGDTSGLHTTIHVEHMEAALSFPADEVHFERPCPGQLILPLTY